MIKLSSIKESLGRNGVRTYLKVKENFPAQTFLPTRSQAKLIKAVGTLTPEVRTFLDTSGNGGGKTFNAINIFLNIAYGKINIFNDLTDCETGDKYKGFDYPFYTNFPRTWPHEAWYITNHESIKSIETKFKKWTHPADTIYQNEGKTHLSKISFKSNNWKMYFKTINQDPDAFETAEVSLIIFDEVPPRRLYAAAWSRLRQGGIIIIVATPLFKAAWFVGDIIDKIDEDKDKYYQKTNCYENCIEKAGYWKVGKWGIHPKGNLFQKNIEAQLRNYDPDELEARRDGTFKFLVGLVYKTYRTITHMLKSVSHPIPSAMNYMYRMVIDPHDRRPPAVIWVRIDKYGRRYIMREWPSRTDPHYSGLPFHKIKSADPYTVKDFVKIFHQIETEELKIPLSRIDQRIMDPNFGRKPNSITGLTIAEEYCKAAKELNLEGKWSFNTNVLDDLAAGHKLVKEYLKPTSDNDYYLLLSPGCYNVDYSFRNYSYEEPEGKAAERIEVSEKVRLIGKDFSDLVRYDLAVPFSYKELLIEKDPYEDTDYMQHVPEWRKKILTKRPQGVAGV